MTKISTALFVFSLIFSSITSLTSAQVTGERILPNEWYVPSEQYQIDVKITIRSTTSDNVVVKETPPQGWQIVRTMNNGIVSGGSITWNINSLSGTKNLLYSLIPSETSREDVTFTGSVNDADITGDSKLIFSTPTPGKQVGVLSGLHNNYWLYLPESYNENQEWPLLLTLHGGPLNASQSNLYSFQHLAPAPHVFFILERPEMKAKVPELDNFVIVSPLGNTGEAFSESALLEVLDQVLSTFSIDHTRISLLGMSLGGIAGWELVVNNPDIFAAFVPLGSQYEESLDDLSKIRDLSIRAFHCEQDSAIPIGSIKNTISRLNELGSNAELIVYPNCDHFGVVEPTYTNPELYQWLLEQRREGSQTKIQRWELH